jgi:hypothetical protein
VRLDAEAVVAIPSSSLIDIIIITIITIIITITITTIIITTIITIVIIITTIIITHCHRPPSIPHLPGAALGAPEGDDGAVIAVGVGARHKAELLPEHVTDVGASGVDDPITGVVERNVLGHAARQEP